MNTSVSHDVETIRRDLKNLNLTDEQVEAVGHYIATSATQIGVFSNMKYRNQHIEYWNKVAEAFLDN